MRCKNCGWPNDDGVARCVKCNASLSALPGGQAAPSAVSDSGVSLNATLREAPADGCASEAPDGCAKCGYPLSAGMKVCPVCHAPVAANAAAAAGDTNLGATVNPWAAPTDTPDCTLECIPWQTETAGYAPVRYAGPSVVLSRANTDAANNTITSREQALLLYEDGRWYIENRSDMHTTLLRVDRRLPLEDGDVIVLGNRMFKFGVK
ncbi:MAG: FHA domain-containing protein [Bacteroides sp.]|nr:FHA domain-containing protein [Bacteroides sp.]MCM1094850.1 FHA domain-containing protein [Terasakiella sp.]